MTSRLYIPPPLPLPHLLFFSPTTGPQGGTGLFTNPYWIYPHHFGALMPWPGEGYPPSPYPLYAPSRPPVPLAPSSSKRHLVISSSALATSRLYIPPSLPPPPSSFLLSYKHISSPAPHHHQFGALMPWPGDGTVHSGKELHSLHSFRSLRQTYMQVSFRLQDNSYPNYRAIRNIWCLRCVKRDSANARALSGFKSDDRLERLLFRGLTQVQ